MSRDYIGASITIIKEADTPMGPGPKSEMSPWPFKPMHVLMLVHALAMIRLKNPVPESK